MFSENKTKASTTGYCDNIKNAADLVQNADYILVGIGSGATAAGGLCYTDSALAEKWYPEYYAKGKKTIFEIMGDFWPTMINERNATAFWGFWAKHIYHIRYEPEALQPYSDLFRLINNKRHFIVTTNVDGQLQKAGFDKNLIFAPQGDYALFQCERPCSQEVYDNKTAIHAMLENMASPFEIRASDIPLCPRCGSLLMPNLRCDMNFVEQPHLQNTERYERFLVEMFGSKLVLLELGVGFNTPSIIRFPFETIALKYPSTILIRVNRDDAATLSGNTGKAISIQDDVKKVLHDLCSVS
jgi:NAD-dependent SIR2 family protein deacetylase